MRLYSKQGWTRVARILCVVPLGMAMACAPTSPGPDSSISPSQAGMHPIDTTSPTDAEQKAMSGEVSCANPSSCHPAVAMLTSLSTDSQLGQCTAFLISPDIAVTNSHCIPTDLKTPGSACGNRIWLHFPALPDYPDLRADCAEVISASALEKEVKPVPDYALIRLAQAVQRPPLEISREGFKDGEIYRILKVDPMSQTSAQGSMTAALCKSVHNSALVPKSSDDRSLNMAFVDCEIVHGNSGSPIVDSQGKVRGVIELLFNSQTVNDSLARQKIPLLEKTAPSLNAGTSLACLDLPQETGAGVPPAECTAIRALSDEASDSSVTRQVSGKLERNLEQAFQKIVSRLNPTFDWSIGRYDTDTEMFLVPVPSCIRDVASLLDRQKSGFFSYKPQAELTLELPRFGVKTGLDRYLVPSFHVDSEASSIQVKAKYSPKALKNLGKTPIEIRSQGADGKSQILFSQSLGACAASQP